MGEIDKDPTIQWLRKNGLPATQENYLDVEFLGEPPEDWQERVPPHVMSLPSNADE